MARKIVTGKESSGEKTTKKRNIKNIRPKDPALYAHVVEYGYGPHIPSRPLFGRTLEEFKGKMSAKVEKARLALLKAWS